MRQFIALCVLLVALAPGAFAQSAGSPLLPGPTVGSQLAPVPTAGSIDDQYPHYVKIRDAFLVQVRHIYFAIGCKIVPGGEFGAAPLLTVEGNDLIKESLAKNIHDPKLHVLISNAGFQGLADAGHGEQCTYWHQHSEEMASIQEQAEAAWNAVGQDP
jgi:hypothetical protein